ncbi:plasminogen-like [Branchiostoma lanceolatum]|uniref:plasminogen-like n=1 Tax=Branchiostoma lanceolatum TaxID=7740 RepID=UPI003454194B
MWRTALLLSVLVFTCLSAPAPSKEKKKSSLQKRCLADMVLEQKFTKIQASYGLCHREAKNMKDSLHKCTVSLAAAKESAAKAPEPEEKKMEHCFVPEMDCFTGYAHYYRGTVSVTENGMPCQRWEAQEPRSHTRTPVNYPNDDLAGNNYCRNPDWGTKPWCYVAEPHPAPRWEYCNVPRCPAA